MCVRAVTVDAPGDPSVLRLAERPTPDVGPREVLVATAFAGVNFADVLMRQGLSNSGYPLVPGVEGSGVVVALGSDVSEVRVGDRVAWAPVKRASNIGSYAELSVIGVEQALPVPDDIPLDTAAAMALQGLTAHYLVHDQHPIEPGTTVLVHAGAGGTGRLVVQWLASLGAEVIATVGSEEKRAVARDAGARHVINYREVDFADEVLALTEGRGVDYVVDGVGAGTFRGDLRAVADRGRICVFGRAAGVPEQFSPIELVFRSITVSGGYMTNFLRDRAEVLRKASELWAAVRDNALTPLTTTLPLEEAHEAHARIESRASVGKFVLEVGGTR